MIYLKRHDSLANRTSYHVGEPDPEDPEKYLSEHLYMSVRHYPQKTYANFWPRNYKENEQMELFQVESYPAKTVVEVVDGTERGRTHFPLMLAIANNESMEKHNLPLTPSHDLSQHSLKVSKNLQKRGLVSESVSLPANPTNTITFNDEPHASFLYDDHREIPKDEVSAGRKSLRNMLRKPRNLSTQFDNIETHHQLELDI